MAYYRDFAIAHFALAFGRLFPRLHVPPCDLSNKTAIITGANSGIGFEIALSLAQRGATVYLACRNGLKASSAVSQITAQVPSSTGRVQALSLDTSSLSSVRTFAQEWISRPEREIHLLFHNAGTCSSSDEAFTPDGFPPIYAANFLGSFLLTHLLEAHLAPAARIILTTSTAQYIGSFSPAFSLTTVQHRFEPGFHFPASSSSSSSSSAALPPTTTTTTTTTTTPAPSPEALYTNTKTMQTAFATLLQRRFDLEPRSGSQRRRLVHAFTPGFTQTSIFEKMAPRSAALDPICWVLKAMTGLATEVGQGAATGVWLATVGEGEGGWQDKGGAGEGRWEGKGVGGEGKGVVGGGYWDRMTRRVAKVEVMDPETVERFWVRWEADAGVVWR